MLFKASRKYAYIQSVDILLPQSWTNIEAAQSSGIAFEVSQWGENRATNVITVYLVQPKGRAIYCLFFKFKYCLKSIADSYRDGSAPNVEQGSQ